MERSETRGLSHRPAEIANDGMLAVTCISCEKLHWVQDPREFNPVCGSCAARDSILGLLQMSGSHPLTDAVIDELLTRTSPGNYALGYTDGDTFQVFYVGRSDSDLRRQLHEWVDTPSRNERWAAPGKAPWRVHSGKRLPVDTAALGRVGIAESTYTRFAYSYARSADEAYAKEWRNYDDFGGSRGLDNETHPVSPDC